MRSPLTEVSLSTGSKAWGIPLGLLCWPSLAAFHWEHQAADKGINEWQATRPGSEIRVKKWGPGRKNGKQIQTGSQGKTPEDLNEVVKPKSRRQGAEDKLVRLRANIADHTRPMGWGSRKVVPGYLGDLSIGSWSVLRTSDLPNSLSSNDDFLHQQCCCIPSRDIMARHVCVHFQHHF